MNRKMQAESGNSAKSRHRLRPDCTQEGNNLLIIKEIGDTGRSFERNQACGVCDQSNLRSNLRRGRLPPGCSHFPLNLSGQRSISHLASLFLKSKICPFREPGALRQLERSLRRPGGLQPDEY